MTKTPKHLTVALTNKQAKDLDDALDALDALVDGPLRASLVEFRNSPPASINAATLAGAPRVARLLDLARRILG